MSLPVPYAVQMEYGHLRSRTDRVPRPISVSVSPEGPLLKSLMPKGTMYTLGQDRTFPNGSKIYLVTEGEKVAIFSYKSGQPLTGYYFNPKANEFLVFEGASNPSRPGAVQERQRMNDLLRYFKIHSKGQALAIYKPPKKGRHL